MEPFSGSLLSGLDELQTVWSADEASILAVRNGSNFYGILGQPGQAEQSDNSYHLFAEETNKELQFYHCFSIMHEHTVAICKLLKHFFCLIIICSDCTLHVEVKEIKHNGGIILFKLFHTAFRPRQSSTEAALWPSLSPTA